MKYLIEIREFESENFVVASIKREDSNLTTKIMRETYTEIFDEIKERILQRDI